MHRLDQKHKELLQQKEELLKESKAKHATMDSVKSQIDGLMKVCFNRLSTTIFLTHPLQNAMDVQKKVADLIAPLPSSASAQTTQ